MKTLFTKIIFAALCVCTIQQTASAQYCTSMPSSALEEDITNFTLGTLNNNSACISLAPGPGSVAGKYSNFTSGANAPAVPSITQGLNYATSVTIQSCNATNRGSSVAIFIDYNADLDFDDVGEKVWNTPLSNNFNSIPAAILPGSFTVPLNATPGITRLRIINAYFYSGPGITPCINDNYGETEDYLVNIVQAPPVDLSIIAQPLPSSAGCYSTAEAVQVTVYNQGSQTINFAVTPATINASVTGPNATVFAPVVINTGTLAVGATLNVNVTSTCNMGAAGTYQFSSSVAVAGDGNASNNTLTPVTHVFNAGYALTPGYGIVCEGSPSNIPLLGLSPAGCTVQWQQSSNNVTWSNIIGQTTLSMTAPVTDTTFYRAVACGLIASVSDTVFTADLTLAPVTMNDTLCGVGNLAVSATVAAGTVHWFNTSTGGPEVGVGTTYTPVTFATQTFWAENQLTDCGQSALPTQPQCYPQFSFGCASGDVILNFSTTGGITNISNLNSGCGASSPTNTAFYPNQTLTIAPGGTFNLTVQSGPTWSQSFRIWIDYNNDGDFADPGEDAWVSGPQTPSPQTGSITVPLSTGVGPKRMRVMSGYATIPTATDWCSSRPFGEVEEYAVIVCTSCTSPRSSATAVYMPSVPVNAVSSNDICGAQTATLTASSNNPGYVYNWSPASTLSASTGNSVTSSATVSTTYTITATDAYGCSDTASVRVNCWVPPLLNATASDFIICPGDSTTLSATHPASSSQITVGVQNLTNTAFSFPAPYGNFNWGSKHQFVIRASELTAAGMVAGYMGSLAFDVTNTNASQSLQNFEINLGNASANVMSGFQNVPMSTVYSSASYVPATGYNTHVFSVPYYWDGVSDLLVQTCHSNSNSSYNCSFRLTQMSYACCTYYTNNSAGVCSSTSSTANSTRRPVMRFNMLYTTGWSYAWTPAVTLAHPASASTHAGPASPQTYTVTITDMHGCTASQNVAVSVVPPPSSFSLGVDTTVCAGTNVTFYAPAGPYSYLWNTANTSTNITVNTGGTYSLTITDNNSGCAASDAVNLMVNPLPNVTLLLPVDTACLNVGAITLSGESPAGGTWSGTAVSGNTFDPMVAGIGTFSISYVYTDNNNCAATVTDSILVDACLDAGSAASAAGDFSVYPNPTAGTFTFSAAELRCEKLTIEMVSVDGKVLMSVQHTNVQGNFTAEIDLNDFANGVYILRVITDGTVYTNRVMKQD